MFFRAFIYKQEAFDFAYRLVRNGWPACIETTPYEYIVWYGSYYNPMEN